MHQSGMCMHFTYISMYFDSTYMYYNVFQWTPICIIGITINYDGMLIKFNVF
jgi:hypothetical protein